MMTESLSVDHCYKIVVHHCISCLVTGLKNYRDNNASEPFQVVFVLIPA